MLTRHRCEVFELDSKHQKRRSDLSTQLNQDKENRLNAARNQTSATLSKRKLIEHQQHQDAKRAKNIETNNSSFTFSSSQTTPLPPIPVNKRPSKELTAKNPYPLAASRKEAHPLKSITNNVSFTKNKALVESAAKTINHKVKQQNKRSEHQKANISSKQQQQEKKIAMFNITLSSDDEDSYDEQQAMSISSAKITTPTTSKQYVPTRQKQSTPIQGLSFFSENDNDSDSDLKKSELLLEQYKRQELQCREQCLKLQNQLDMQKQSNTGLQQAITSLTSAQQQQQQLEPVEKYLAIVQQQPQEQEDESLTSAQQQPELFRVDKVLSQAYHNQQQEQVNHTETSTDQQQQQLQQQENVLNIESENDAAMGELQRFIEEGFGLSLEQANENNLHKSTDPVEENLSDYE